MMLGVVYVDLVIKLVIISWKVERKLKGNKMEEGARSALSIAAPLGANFCGPIDLILM